MSGAPWRVLHETLYNYSKKSDEKSVSDDRTATLAVCVIITLYHRQN